MNRAKRLENYRLKARVGGCRVFLTVDIDALGGVEGLWLDLDVRDASASMRTLASMWSSMASKAIRCGCTVESVVDEALYTRFEPAGVVQGGSGRVKLATSLLDWAAKEIGIKHLGREELANV
jgi:ribonucleoside-diphosphate reductase alpha chain